MKKFIHVFIHFLFLNQTFGQNYLIANDEMSLHRAEMYGIIGRINERVQLYVMRDEKLLVTAFDEKLHKLGDREIELEKKGTPQLLDIVTLKNDFSAIFTYTKKGHKYLKINKYDVHGRLLDSATIHPFGKIDLPKLTFLLSEDKQRFLVHGFIDNERLIAVAGRLDSLKAVWSYQMVLKDWNPTDHLKQIAFNNRADMYVIWEKDNRLMNLEKHAFAVKTFGLNGESLDTVRMSEAVSTNVKFVYDNQNQRLVGGGFYTKRWNGKIQGSFYISLTPKPEILLQPFENEFIAQALGKKETTNKGLDNLEVRDLILRRDGGFLMLSEQSQTVSRFQTAYAASATTSNPGYMQQARAMVDHYYDDFYLFAFHPKGQLHWKKILHKKQYSQDDGGNYSSCFVLKTPSGLRLVYNDEIDRATTVSEYALKGDGTVERHSVMNTTSLDIMMRFRDAIQIGANELLVPSEIRGRAKLVKIVY